MNRRAFLGLIGASALLPLIPKTEPVTMGVDLAKGESQSWITITAHNIWEQPKANTLQDLMNHRVKQNPKEMRKQVEKAYINSLFSHKGTIWDVEQNKSLSNNAAMPK